VAIKRTWPLYLISLLVLACVSFQLLLLRDAENRAREWLQGRTELKKILYVSLRIWQERGELDEQRVWQEFRRTTPILDPWGVPYRVRANPVELEAFSHGPDRLLGTLDDINLALSRSLPQSASNLFAPHDGEPETAPSDAEAKSLGHGAQ
jgi:hypothetical protein